MVCPIPRTGRLGFVGDYTNDTLTRFGRVRNWTFDGVANPETRVYAGTRYGTDRIPGFVEYTGSFQGFGGIPPLFAGDAFTFLGYTAPTSGVECTPGCAFTVPAVVTSLNITWNWTAENRGVNWTVNFGSTGGITPLPTFDDDCDDEVYCDDNPCSLTFQMYDCEDDPIEWCNLTSVSVTFTSNVLQYSNSSTDCQILKAVGNLDWTMEVVDQNTCLIPVTNEQYWFEIMATSNPVTLWILKYALATGFTNLRVDTESQEVISKTNTFGMKAVSCCEPATPTLGSINEPLGATVWPYATAS